MPGLEVLGSDFQKQYQDSLKKRRRLSRLVLSDNIKREVIELVKNNMTAETAILPYKKGNRDYTILLVEAPRNLDKVKKYINSTGNYRLGMLWRGEWITAFMGQKDLDKIQASTLEDIKYYILVGYMKQSMYNDKVSWTISVYGIITMDEIAGFEIEQQKQDEAVQNSVNEHKAE